MYEPWRILFYTTEKGEQPVGSFIKSLELKAQTKVYHSFELLKQYGTAVGAPHIKKLQGTKLWELRILGSDSIRFFYVAATGKTFVILHGFQKKKNKTPLKEIRTAQYRLSEIQKS